MEFATTSTAAVSTIYTLTWASSELVRITTSLTDTIRRMVPATCNTVDLLFNIIEVHLLMEELRLKAFKLARLACELAKAATVITNADRDYSEAVSNSEEVFRPFSRLPTELRLLIWTMAAQPPSFAIAYFMSFEATLAGREPAARFMDNRALWTTCWESRNTIKRVYEKNSVSSFAGSSVSEMRYFLLATFNRMAEDFKQQCRQFAACFRANIERVDFLIGEDDDDMIKFGHGWVWNLADSFELFYSFNRICTKLRREHLI